MCAAFTFGMDRGVGFQPALSNKMHKYSVHNRGRAVFSFSYGRLAATLGLAAICVRTCRADTERGCLTRFFSRRG